MVMLCGGLINRDFFQVVNRKDISVDVGQDVGCWHALKDVWTEIVIKHYCLM